MTDLYKSILPYRKYQETRVRRFSFQIIICHQLALLLFWQVIHNELCLLAYDDAGSAYFIHVRAPKSLTILPHAIGRAGNDMKEHGKVIFDQPMQENFLCFFFHV